MLKFIENIISKIIFKLFLSKVNFEETSEIKRIINKSMGLNWATMDNVMVFKNTFPVPYTIKSIKTTMYNDSGQNIGYMDFEGDILVPKNGEVERKIESRMSNITAIFNVARFVLFDQIKIKAEGYSEIKIWRFTFKLPVSMVVQVTSKMIQFQTDEQIEEAKKRREKESLIRAYKKQKEIERKQREKEAYLAKKEKEAQERLKEKQVVSIEVEEKIEEKISETTEIINIQLESSNADSEVLDNNEKPEENL
jgi:hypothetical protein